MAHRPNNPPVAFTLLAKPAGPACNLACQYCFYLDRQQLYPASRFRMPEEVLQAYIRQMLACQPSREVSISWQGGEPTLMGLDFFEHSIDVVNRYKKPYQRITYTLQTNGTLLDDGWCSFFRKHKFLVGLSMDGTAELHNAYRLNKGGLGSFNQVRHAWDLLQEHRVDTNILCAVHAANASHALEVYQFFRDDLGAHFIQFIPIVERLPGISLPANDGSHEPPGTDRSPVRQDAGLVSQRSVKPDQYGAFLVEIFDEWVRRDVGDIFIQSFDAALASWCRLPSSVCVFQQVCGSSLVLEHNGDLYSCDHFVDPAHRLGNILEKPLSELVRSPRQRQFGLSKRTQLPKYCRNCTVRFACQGECPRNRFTITPDGRDGELNYLCPSYKAFFQHVDQPMRIMTDLLRRGRTPADIMDMGRCKKSV